MHTVSRCRKRTQELGAFGTAGNYESDSKTGRAYVASQRARSGFVQNRASAAFGAPVTLNASSDAIHIEIERTEIDPSVDGAAVPELSSDVASNDGSSV